MKKELFQSQENEQEPIEISFGAIHTYRGNNRLKYVILDVGQDNWFIASQLMPGQRLGIPGTGGASDIENIIGFMGLEDILKGLEKSVGSLSDSMISEVRNGSLKPPRNLRR